jgi:ABC-type uncharacterized transport system auxiliary subunit
MTQKLSIRALLLLSSLTLGGCISIGGTSAKNEAPPSIYTLHVAAAAGSAVATPRRSTVIVVATPEVPPGFGTDRIALSFEEDHRLDYYAGAKWSARLDDLLQNFIIQALRRWLPGATVGTPDLGAAAKYRLTVRVTDFQPVYQKTADAAPRLDVAMTLTLMALPGEAVKTTVILKRSAPASANTQTAVTSGMEQLLQSLMNEAGQKIAPYLNQ